MARKLVAVEIAFVGCVLEKTLAENKKESTHMVQSTLIWPRVGIASRTSACKVALSSGNCDMKNDRWGKRILFKENVESVFSIKVDITEPIVNETLEEFLRFMGGTVLGLGAEILEDAGPGGPLVSAPAEFMAKKIKQIPEAEVIGSGLIDLPADEIPLKGELLLDVELFSPRDVVKRSRRTVNRKTKVTRKVLMKKDDSNGKIILSIKRI